MSTDRPTPADLRERPVLGAGGMRRAVVATVLASICVLTSACSGAPEVPDRYLQPSDVEELGLAVEESGPVGALVFPVSCSGPDWHQELGGGGGVLYRVGVDGDVDAGSLRDDVYAVEDDVLEKLWGLVDTSPEDCPSSTPIELDDAAVREVAAADVRVIRREDDVSALWRAYVHDDGMLVVVQADGSALVPGVDLTSAVGTAVERAVVARTD